MPMWNPLGECVWIHQGVLPNTYWQRATAIVLRWVLRALEGGASWMNYQMWISSSTTLSPYEISLNTIGRVHPVMWMKIVIAQGGVNETCDEQMLLWLDEFPNHLIRLPFTATFFGFVSFWTRRLSLFIQTSLTITFHGVIYHFWGGGLILILTRVITWRTGV